MISLFQQSGVVPLTLKQKKNIKPYIPIYLENKALDNFEFIASEKNILNVIPEMMAKHNLLLNDAIILSACIMHRIPKSASFLDFKIPANSYFEVQGRYLFWITLV